MNKILLFIPMYNCEKQIPRVISQLSTEVLSFISQVIIVDNGSIDDSRYSAIKELENKKINGFVVLNDANYNLGGSHKVAFNYAIDNDFTHVIVLHGDDQGDIKDLLPYLKDGTFDQYESFLGARFHKKSSLVGYSNFRIFGNHVVNYACSLLLRRSILDLGSGLNMYKVSFLKSKFYLAFANDLTFNVYLLFWALKKKRSLCYFPLTWREDDQISNARVFKQAIHILSLAIKMVFNADSVLIKDEKNLGAIMYSFKKVLK